jgi:hypothetical protein
VRLSAAARSPRGRKLFRRSIVEAVGDDVAAEVQAEGTGPRTVTYARDPPRWGLIDCHDGLPAGRPSIVGASQTTFSTSEKEQFFMKRLVHLKLMLLAVIGMVLLLFDVPESYAWPSVGECPNQCTFVGFTCSDVGGVKTCTCGGTLGDVTLEAIHIVQSENDNQLAQCRADIPKSDAPPQAVVCNVQDDAGDTCTGGINGPNSTNDWKQVITPSGQVVLTCHFRQP